MCNQFRSWSVKKVNKMSLSVKLYILSSNNLFRVGCLYSQAFPVLTMRVSRKSFYGEYWLSNAPNYFETAKKFQIEFFKIAHRILFWILGSHVCTPLMILQKLSFYISQNHGSIFNACFLRSFKAFLEYFWISPKILDKPFQCFRKLLKIEFHSTEIR